MSRLPGCIPMLAVRCCWYHWQQITYTKYRQSTCSSAHVKGQDCGILWFALLQHDACSHDITPAATAAAGSDRRSCVCESQRFSVLEVMTPDVATTQRRGGTCDSASVRKPQQHTTQHNTSIVVSLVDWPNVDSRDRDGRVALFPQELHQSFQCTQS